MEEKKINTRIVFSIVAVLLLIAVVAGATYAYFSATGSSAAQTVTTATMDLAFDDSTAIINATNITPMYQSEIETKATKKSFTVTNNGTQSMYLQMQLTEVTIDDALKDVWFRWALYEEGTRIGIGTFYEAGTEVFMQQNMVIEPGTANAKDYDLYIWIEESDEEQNTMQGKTFSGKITVNGSMTEYEDVLMIVKDPYGYGSEGIQNIYYPTNTTSVTFEQTNVDGSELHNTNKFTNLQVLNFIVGYVGKFSKPLPVSLTTLVGSPGQMASTYEDDFSYLTNLTNLEGIGSSDSIKTIKLPKSLTSIIKCYSYNADISGMTSTTIDLSNLVNLTTVTDSFNTLTTEHTVILPASIKDTVTISNSFGSATVVYQ